ncbi:hypothetical protein BH24GEM1_BH24GEM1_13160 [soil metagenome]
MAAGLGSIAAGIAQAHSGFSPFAMALSMVASSVLLVWVIILGAFLWRLGQRLAREADVS